MKLSTLAVGAGALTGELYLGVRNKAGDQLLAKRPAEPEILLAVKDHMMFEAPKGASKSVTFDNGQSWFKISVEPIERPADGVGDGS